MTMYYVATGNDDYYTDSHLGTQYTDAQIITETNNTLTPSIYKELYAKVDTSGIGTEVISIASVIFDEYTYFASKGITKEYHLRMLMGSSYVTLATYTYGTSAVTRTYDLTSAQIAYIDKTGYTCFKIEVDDPGATKTRTINVQAYENSQATAFRMDITHAPASTYSAVIIS